MVTKEACKDCPVRGDADLVPDQLVPSPVLILKDKVGDPDVPPRLLQVAKVKTASVAHALRCAPAARLRSGKKFEKALAACRQHDRMDGVTLAICLGPTGHKALGLNGFATVRGHVIDTA